MTKKEFFLGFIITLIALITFFAFFVEPKYGPQIEKLKKENTQQENKKEIKVNVKPKK